MLLFVQINTRQRLPTVFDPYVYLAYLYVVLRLIVPLPFRRLTRVILAVVTLLICKHHLIQKWVFGTMFSPEIPRPFVIALGVLYCAFVLIFLITAAVDLVLLVVRGVRRGRRIDARILHATRCGIVVAGMTLSAVGVYNAVQLPEVRRVELAIRDLPAGLDGFRLVQLSDLHISRLMHAPWVSEVVGRTNALQADLIVVSGDLIDGTTAARTNDVRPLADLRARHGVIASLGNHEYYFDAPRWRTEFERLGMTVLVNAHTVIGHGGSALTIAGVTDPVAPRYGLQGPDTARALAGAPQKAPIVLLSHQPIDASQNAWAGVDLQLSGHTHGGMVRGIDLLVKRANNGFVSGLYNVADMRLYVSNGTGLWNGFPIRLGVPPEITEFILRPHTD